MLGRPDAAPPSRIAAQLAVWELCEQFLEWVEIHRATKTFSDYKDWLSRWVKLHGREAAHDIRPLDLEKWKAPLVRSGFKPATVNHAIISARLVGIGPCVTSCCLQTFCPESKGSTPRAVNGFDKR